MQAIRLGGSLVLGVIVAFALFIVMSLLIRMGEPELDKKAGTKIADFTMPKVEIEAQVDDDLPEIEEILDEPPPEQDTQDIDIDAGDSGLNISSGVAKAEVNIDAGVGVSSDSEAMPVFVPTPRYPPRAERQGKAGYAVVQVTITPTGTTKDVVLVEEFPENFGFGKSAVKAAQKLRYNPKIVDGIGVDVPGVLYKFTFAGFGK